MAEFDVWSKVYTALIQQYTQNLYILYLQSGRKTSFTEFVALRLVRNEMLI